MSPNDVKKVIEDSVGKFKILAELSRGRLYIECEVGHLETDARLQSIRAQQPKDSGRKEFDDDVKDNGLINAIQTLPNVAADGSFHLLVWDGNQRRKAVLNKDSKAIVDAIVWTDLTIEQAIERGTAANFLRFEGEDDDIFSILASVTNKGTVAKLTGMSEKNVGRYMELDKAGFRAAIKSGAFTASYGLDLLKLAGADDLKKKVVIRAAENRLEFAENEKRAEIIRAKLCSEKPDEEKTTISKYFTADLMSAWEDELAGATNDQLTRGEFALQVDPKKKTYIPIKKGKDEDWLEGIPKALIEGRKWSEVGPLQFAALKAFAERLIEEAEEQESNLKRKQKRASRVKAEQAERRAPMATHDPEDEEVVVKQDAPKAKRTPIHTEGVGAGENPPPEVLKFNSDTEN